MERFFEASAQRCLPSMDVYVFVERHGRMIPLTGELLMERPPHPSSAEAPGLRIGEVAKRTGLSVKTIRFYCDQGLLQPSGRSESGYRLFNEECFAELNLIRALRVMDVPLAELARILEVRRAGVCHCSSLKNSISTKITSIDERIFALESMKTELLRLLETWQKCGGKPDT